MKRIWIFLLLFSFSIVLIFGQSPEIKAIMEKARSGKQLSDSEMQKLQQWGEEMRKNAGKNPTSVSMQPTSSQKAAAQVNGLCPPKTSLSSSPALTRDSYVRLAKELMTTYGASSGQEAELNKLLDSAAKPTDGADMGGILMLTGAGSASIYATAWSAVQQPADVLTANNLGVALKDMGELSQALRILKYAESLRPNAALIQGNLGWVYWEAGEPSQAEIQFRKALNIAPEMVSANLGMGLSLNCQGKKTEAEVYLRKALKERHSAIGIMAYRQSAQTGKPGQDSGKNPISDEKGSTEGLELPELPVYETPEKMMPQREILENYLTGLQSRSSTLSNRLHTVADLIRNQQARAMEDPGNSLVYRCDFNAEMMHFEDITLLLFGETSNFGKAKQEGHRLQAEAFGKVAADIMPEMPELVEKLNRLNYNRFLPLEEEYGKCGDNELCKAEVQKKIDAVKFEMDQVVFRMCKLSKQQMDMQIPAYGKSNTMTAQTLKEAARDYYAFTDPVLERIYAPALNEFYNLYRETIIFNEYQLLTRNLIAMSEISRQYMELKCVEPELPALADPEITDHIPEKKNKPCPLGEKGIGLGVGALSFELGCTHVKISGGEGFLFSVKRDFAKHETTLWAGVGAKSSAGVVSVEASVGVELTVGNDNSVKDVAFTSTLKAGLGGFSEAEVSGRFAAEGGPAINFDAGLSLPSIPF